MWAYGFSRKCGCELRKGWNILRNEWLEEFDTRSREDFEVFISMIYTVRCEIGFSLNTQMFYNNPLD
jgi:hypothetical protein